METGCYRFGEFELNRITFELQRSGTRLRLERLPLELLLLLASRRGELVSREEIIATLWGNEIFIDTNTAINVAVRKIRQVLDASRDLQLKALAKGGAQSYWQMQLQLSEQQPSPPEGYATLFGVAVIYARLGKSDQAIAALQQAFDCRDVQLTEINVEPAFDGLRGDARFQDLLRRVHLSG